MNANLSSSLLSNAYQMTASTALWNRTVWKGVTSKAAGPIRQRDGTASLDTPRKWTSAVCGPAGRLVGIFSWRWWGTLCFVFLVQVSEDIVTFRKEWVTRKHNDSCDFFFFFLKMFGIHPRTNILGLIFSSKTLCNVNKNTKSFLYDFSQKQHGGLRGDWMAEWVGACRASAHRTLEGFQVQEEHGRAAVHTCMQESGTAAFQQKKKKGMPKPAKACESDCH